MNSYQSFGAGVNSVALAEFIKNEPMKIFADTGCEYPETYDYLKNNYDRPLTILNDPVEGCKTIEEWCYKIGSVPYRKYRSCTDKFKIRRIERYIKKPCVIYIGFAYDERHRARIDKKGKIKYEYPLIENGIKRNDCLEIIVKSGLKIPPKSGCWLCPFQSKSAWWRLGRNHPDLFWRAVKLDELNKKIRYFPNRALKDLWPPQTVFYDDPGWECQFCMIDGYIEVEE